MRTRPRRASNGPSSNTDPLSRPTNVASGSSLADIRAPDSQRRRANPVYLGAEVEKEACHDLDIADARYVFEDAFLFGEEARRNQRQRRVLVAFDLDTAAESAGRLR